MAPSASEIIAAARYLEEDFAPSTLTAAQLRGVLSHHSIAFPTSAPKSKLVDIFEKEIKNNLGRYRQERLETDGSQASNSGILDGITGEQVSDPESVEEIPPPTTRRSSRRPSVRPSPAPAPAEAPKRRRVAPGPSAPAPAAPAARGARATRAPAPSRVIEESEPEDEDDREEHIRPRKKKTQGNGETKKRRGSSKVNQFGEDSGWEDNNVFQSGPDDTPPAKARRRSPSVPRRGGRTTRAASGPRSPEPIQAETSSPANRPPSSPVFAPRLPVDVSRSVIRRTSAELTTPKPVRTLTRSPAPPQPESYSDVEEPDSSQEVVRISDDESPSLRDADEHNAAISSRMGDLSSKAVIRRTPISHNALFNLTRVASVISFVFSVWLVWLYKTESSAIGYCDAGTNNNTYLQSLRDKRVEIHNCNERLQKFGPDSDSDSRSRVVDGAYCPLESLLPAPDACTPCPSRTTCSRHQAVCQGAFIPLEHPFAQVPLVLTLSNGLPGFGSVAFPVQCVEDRARLKKVGVLGKTLENWLAKVKGDKVCKGLAKTSDGGDAKAWGVPRLQLKIRAKEALKNKVPENELNTMFDDALIELERNGLVVVETDANGTLWVGALKSDMDVSCHAKVIVRDAWHAWRRYLYTVAFVAASIVYARAKVASRQIEARRVADLVQIALDTLRHQEISHHTDPVSAPQSFLSPMHLRDLILQDEHSPAKRRRLWEKVERVVEGNANVRANIEDVNGDETRVWRWVGAAAGLSPQKRVQWSPKLEE